MPFKIGNLILCARADTLPQRPGPTRGPTRPEPGPSRIPGVDEALVPRSRAVPIPEHLNAAQMAWVDDPIGHGDMNGRLDAWARAAPMAAEKPKRREGVNRIRKLIAQHEKGRAPKTLDLGHLGLTALTAEIGRLPPSLEIFWANGNLLGSVVPQLGHLVNLRQLSLADNQLSELPEEIGNLSLLETLDVSSNFLNRLPDAVSKLNSLKVLRAGTNKLQPLPDGMKDMQQLSELDMSNNNLRFIPPAWSGTLMDRLSKLDVSNNPTLLPMTQDMKMPIRMVVLNVSGNPSFNTLPMTFGTVEDISDAQGEKLATKQHTSRNGEVQQNMVILCKGSGLYGGMKQFGRVVNSAGKEKYHTAPALPVALAAERLAPLQGLGPHTHEPADAAAAEAFMYLEGNQGPGVSNGLAQLPSLPTGPAPAGNAFQRMHDWAAPLAQVYGQGLRPAAAPVTARPFGQRNRMNEEPPFPTVPVPGGMGQQGGMPPQQQPGGQWPPFAAGAGVRSAPPVHVALFGAAPGPQVAGPAYPIYMQPTYMQPTSMRPAFGPSASAQPPAWLSSMARPMMSNPLAGGGYQAARPAPVDPAFPLVPGHSGLPPPQHPTGRVAQSLRWLADKMPNNL